jgi:DNA-binding transcriptional ArsR family regulator
VITEDLHAEDDWDKLLKAGQRRAAKQDEKRANRSSKPAQRFVQVSIEWLERLRSAKHIATYRMAFFLSYQSWQTNYRPIRVSNVALEDWGVSRRQKSVALQELENLGLIEVERRGRRAPIVTLQ